MVYILTQRVLTTILKAGDWSQKVWVNHLRTLNWYAELLESRARFCPEYLKSSLTLFKTTFLCPVEGLAQNSVTTLHIGSWRSIWVPPDWIFSISIPYRTLHRQSPVSVWWNFLLKLLNALLFPQGPEHSHIIIWKRKQAHFASKCCLGSTS
jgi:hypothetical protein